MNYRLHHSCQGVDWKKAARIFELAPLGTRDPDKLRRCFEATHTVCFAYDGDQLVGLGRALSDGVSQAVVYDLCLLPGHQGKGLGSLMLQDIMDRCGAEHIMLYAVPGKEAFYNRFGFARMLTAMSRKEDNAKMRANGYIE